MEAEQIECQEATPPVRGRLSLEGEDGTGVDMASMSLLMKITRADGTSLPFGKVSDALVLEMIQNATEVTPLNITALNDQDIVADFPGDTDVQECKLIL